MLPSGVGNDVSRPYPDPRHRRGFAMTEALRAAIAALDETDHTRLPAQMVAEIVLAGAASALRRQFEEEIVAPIRAELEAAQQALASCAG
jgi:hypothetical protein